MSAADAHTHTHTQNYLILLLWRMLVWRRGGRRWIQSHAHGMAHTRAGMDRASIDKGAGVGGPPSSTILPAAPAAVDGGHPSRAHRSLPAPTAADCCLLRRQSDSQPPRLRRDPRWPNGLTAQRTVRIFAAFGDRIVGPVELLS